MVTVAMDIRLHVLEKITNNFSPDFKIGSGGYGDVYKGVLCDGELIAVKLLHCSVEGLDDKLFKNEVGNLLMVDHPNIVQFLGYCYETQSKYIKYNGENVFGKHIHKVLCFEYLEGGSLDKRLPEKSFAPNWSTRYNIMKGICEGLNFLHGQEKPIFHLDLKPGNILLNSFLVPKLADFGLSRLISGSHTHVTQKRIGTDKYMPPEYRNGGNISEKNDVFSLGVVMLDIMQGPEDYFPFRERGKSQFKKEVLAKWSSMIGPTMKYRPQLLLQVNKCIDIAMDCVDYERNVRPTIATILANLNETETQIPSKQSADVPPCLTIDLKNSLAKTMKMSTAELDNITNLVADMEGVPDIREASSNVEESLIIGRNEEKQEILSILSKSSTHEMIILPIYGMGGIGKTTLAKLVFDDTQFSGYSRVWVKVSKTLDLNEIGNSIISQLTNKVSDIANDWMLKQNLAMLPAHKSILIVLDDLWENDPCKIDELKAMLRLGQGRKVILVTTRDETIARNICNNVKMVKLDILTDDMCWTIIKQKSCFEDRHAKTHSAQIGRDIAIKCRGVALAAQSLGYMLRDMTSDQWESVRDSDIWNLSTSEDPSLRIHEVLASLRLSYSHMHQWLQSCFSYCGVFRKGHNIVKHDLIHQWIALEFTEPSKMFDSMQQCERYITHLLGLSFLQYSMDYSLQDDKYTTLFTMHDLVHDLATATLADKVNKNGNEVGSSCQYALVRDPSKPLRSFVSSPENLKALHFLGYANIMLSDGAISPAKCLRVLDLGGCYIGMLPDSIGQLKQLRYLHAPFIHDRMIPNCITELSKLNYLCLRDSSMKALPPSIGDMKGLMHFDLSDCHGLSELPVSFGDLKQLVYLNLSSCSVPIYESWGGFTRLQYLNLSESWGDSYVCDVKVLVEVIGKLTKLQYLNLARRLLPLASKVLPEVLGKLTKLQYLNLAECMKMMPEADIHSLLVGISALYNLEHLDLYGSEQLNSIPESICNLTKLHTLGLLGCNIQKLPARMVKMASLKIIKMDPLRVCGSNLSLIALAKPSKLKISKLEDVKSLEEAQSIKLIDNRILDDLELEWTVGCHKRSVDEKDVLEELVPPNTVHFLKITGYMSLSFPNWLMGIGQYLPCVREIILKDISNCNNLPPLGQLRELTILRLFSLGSLEELNTADFCGELMFPKLCLLDIKACPKLRLKPWECLSSLTLAIDESDNMLTSWGECVSQTSAFSSSFELRELKVKRSKVPLRQWTLLQHVSYLRDLTIKDCSDLTSYPPGAIQCLSSVELLDLEDDILTELPTWLVELTSLSRLIISFPKLEKLNDSTRQLTRLQYLVLSGCGSLTSLPQWLGELTSLRELCTTGCEGIRSLPGSIRHLTELESLSTSARGSGLYWVHYIGFLPIHDSHVRQHYRSRGRFYLDGMCGRFYKEGACVQRAIRKVLSSISADTDEVNIQDMIEEYEKEFVKEVEEYNMLMSTEEESTEEESTEGDIEEHEEDVNNSADAADANVESGSSDAVNTWTRENRTHKRRVVAAGTVIVEAPGQAEKRPRHLVPAASAATTNSPDTSSGSRIDNNGTSADALIMPVPSLSALANEPGSSTWLDCYFS